MGAIFGSDCFLRGISVFSSKLVFSVSSICPEEGLFSGAALICF